MAPRADTAGTARTTALRTAAAGMATALVVLAVMTAVGLRSSVSATLDSRELAGLKAALRNDPANETLKQRIREVDLEVRRKYFERQRLLNSGRYVLPAALVLVLACLHVAAYSGGKIPQPLKAGERRETEAPGRSASLRSVGVVALVLAGVVVFAGTLTGGIDETALRRLCAEKNTAKVRSGPVAYPADTENRKNWPRFRGADGAGYVPEATGPSAWDVATGKGVIWKEVLPMKGASSPVIWGGRLFLTGADKENREVYCYESVSGELLWTHKVGRLPGGSDSFYAELWNDETYAASTPATDGTRVYAAFANGDLVCLDFNGSRQWARSLGVIRNSYGFSTSPVLYRNLLYLQLDQARTEDGRTVSRLLAVDKTTGKDIRSVNRPVLDSWSTPLVMAVNGSDQLITTSSPWIIGYDAATTEEIWRIDRLDTEVVASPVAAAGRVIAGCSEYELVAVDPSGSGEVSKTHVTWFAEEDVPDVLTPVTDGRLLFVADAHGMLSCYEAATGKRLWNQKLEGSFWASPIIIGGRLYLFSKDGKCHIVEAADSYRPVALIDMGEKISATPAFAGGRLFVRGRRHLFCICGDD
ncbi:MAG: PQQ-binding-like beta-propeller repeat protein [Planctomycetes bacterium]|nr:PQQ-binding-like beta-propeller repeat protein [Planctomycetota bacterium]